MYAIRHMLFRQANRIVLCGAVRPPADEPVLEPEPTAQVPRIPVTLPESGWDRLAEQLGAPDDPMAMDRAQQLVANGWELLGVQFTRGTWHFRRPRLMQAAEPTNDVC